jgi:hypothetical protein
MASISLSLVFEHPEPGSEKREHIATYYPDERAIYLECCQFSEVEAESLSFFTIISDAVRKACDGIVCAIIVRPEAQAVKLLIL